MMNMYHGKDDPHRGVPFEQLFRLAVEPEGCKWRWTGPYLIIGWASDRGPQDEQEYVRIDMEDGNASNYGLTSVTVNEPSALLTALIEWFDQHAKCPDVMLPFNKIVQRAIAHHRAGRPAT